MVLYGGMFKPADQVRLGPGHAAQVPWVRPQLLERPHLFEKVDFSRTAFFGLFSLPLNCTLFIDFETVQIGTGAAASF